ncbi:MAG TPA: dihydrofolate reductase family protein [Microlunatus sp.]
MSGMADLVYYSQCSVDGYIADAGGDFSWAFPPEDVHRAANDAAARTGIHLLGRRTYEVMRYWDEAQPDAAEVEADFQRAWAPSEKVVYSRTIDRVGPNARIEREFDPAAARAIADAADAEVEIGGASLGGQALRAGIVDVLTLVLFPVIIGGGLRVIPQDLRLDLQLTERRDFSRGIVQLSYRVPRAEVVAPPV